MQPNQTALIPELKKISAKLMQGSKIAVAHNRKFTYICTQFERFAQEYEAVAKPEPLTTEMIQAYKDFLGCANQILSLFSQNDTQGWAHNALEHSCSQLATDITTIVTTLQITAVALCPNAVNIFDPTSAQWLQYHILDIKAIYASFVQYIDNSQSLQIEKEVIDAMTERIKSIDNFCEEYKNEEVPPGCVVFSPIPVHYQKWRLTPSDFAFEERVGHGISASVFYGHIKKDGREVAIKKLKYKHLSGSKLQTFQREITIFATCHHPCILQFIGATDSQPFCIVSEWMPGGNLFHDLHKVHSLDATYLSIALFDIARGMAFLHSRQIMHRDLKSLNILIDSHKLTRICDFGFSRKTAEKDELLTKNVGTPIWMAPELLNTANGYDLKVDVYAYAIVAWEILTGETPYGTTEPQQIIANVLIHDARPPIPSNTPPELSKLITQCWDKDPTRRPEFSEIVDRIVSEHIILPGADANFVMEYMRKNGYDTSKPAEDPMPNLDNILAMDHSSPEFFKGIIHSIKSERGKDAAVAFKQLNNVPKQVCMEAISLVPTGNEAIDLEIIIALCKNGFPGPACLHALKNEHVMITFEVISKKGVPEEEKDPIIDRCIRSLQSNSPQLILSAARCLMKIGGISKLTMDNVKLLIGSDDNSVRAAGAIIASKLASDGVKLSLEIIDMMIQRWKTDLICNMAIISACGNKEVAEHVMNSINSGDVPNDEALVNLINKMVIHKELHSALKAFIEATLAQSNKKKTVEQANLILKKIT